MNPTDPSGAVGTESLATNAEKIQKVLPAHFTEKSPLTDTAGVPWKGRDYTVSPFPEDHGATPQAVGQALAAVRAGQDPHRATLVGALSDARVLVPIMAVATEKGTTAHGLTGDNGADMAMVTLVGNDGSRVLPLFTSVEQLSAWNPSARPVPVVMPQAAQAAVQEGCTGILLNPADVGGPLYLQRSILWACAQGRAWVPPHEDPAVQQELTEMAASVPDIHHITPLPGPLHEHGAGAEVILQVALEPGLDQGRVQTAIQHLSSLLAASTTVADRITAVKLALVAAAG